MDTTSNTPAHEPTVVSLAQWDIEQYDALTDDDWAAFTTAERTAWTARLATSLRRMLIALGQQP